MKGSCHCGNIEYRLNGDVKNIVNCHCNLCRKMNGSAFATYVVVLESDFELLQGEPRSIEVTDKVQKYVCGNCCSPLYNVSGNYGGLRILYVGSLNDASDLAPAMNIYCESKLSWLDDIGEYKSFEQGITR